MSTFVKMNKAGYSGEYLMDRSFKRFKICNGVNNFEKSLKIPKG